MFRGVWIRPGWHGATILALLVSSGCGRVSPPEDEPQGCGGVVGGAGSSGGTTGGGQSSGGDGGISQGATGGREASGGGGDMNAGAGGVGSGAAGEAGGGPEDPCDPSTCGDGVRCDDEVCDDGFATPCGACNAACSGPGSGNGFCGDGVVCEDAGEVCDDARSNDCGTCNADCSGPGTGNVCGDGILCEGSEVCDDGHNTDCGFCNATCTALGPGKQCNDGAFCPDIETDLDCGGQCGLGTCLTGQRCRDDEDCSSAYCRALDGRCSVCGNQTLNTGEACDGAQGIPGGGQVSCFPPHGPLGCEFDFAGVTQMLCDAACSWGGNAGCDQADADIFCKLVTGFSGSVASSFSVGTTLAEPGFACATGVASGSVISLGNAAERGVAQTVMYDTSDLVGSYGPNLAAIVSAVCTGAVCGDGTVSSGERCDGDEGLPPGDTVGCRPDCRYNFSEVEQLYCAGACSWAGGAGCDQADADVLCQLKLGNPNATARAFSLGAPLAAGGFDCAQEDRGMDLGPHPEFGVNGMVRYRPGSLAAVYPSMFNDDAIVAVECMP